MIIPILTENPNEYPIQSVCLVVAVVQSRCSQLRKITEVCALACKKLWRTQDKYSFSIISYCELNWIEYNRGRCKHFTRKHYNYTLANTVTPH